MWRAMSIKCIIILIQTSFIIWLIIVFFLNKICSYENLCLIKQKEMGQNNMIKSQIQHRILFVGNCEDNEENKITCVLVDTLEELNRNPAK